MRIDCAIVGMEMFACNVPTFHSLITTVVIDLCTINKIIVYNTILHTWFLKLSTEKYFHIILAARLIAFHLAHSNMD